MNEAQTLLVEAYLDGTLDGDGATALTRLLDAGGAEAAEIRERIAFAGLLGQALDPATPDDLARSVAERLTAQGQTTAMVRAVGRSLDRPGDATRRRPARQRTAPIPWLIAALVLVAVLAGGWWTLTGRQSAQCQLSAGSGLLTPHGVALASGAWLRSGDTISTAVGTTLVFTDGTRLTLAAGTRLSLLDASAGKRLLLSTGELLAEVVPQAAGRPLIITTPNARVEVVGTRFTLNASDSRSRIDLHQGTVRLKRLPDLQTITVHAGETAIAAPGIELIAKPWSATPPPAPPAPATSGATTIATAVAPPPAAVTWTPLFPAGNLAAWTPQHGTWVVDGDIVRGSDPLHHGKARLLSLHAYRHLELRCRLRINHVEHAEVQIGDYNWFFTVPAIAAGAWIEVRLTQHGDGKPTCTANGMALTAEPGAGTPTRTGALGFYVMPGGSLEITDAFIHLLPEP